MSESGAPGPWSSIDATHVRANKTSQPGQSANARVTLLKHLHSRLHERVVPTIQRKDTIQYVQGGIWPDREFPRDAASQDAFKGRR